MRKLTCSLLLALACLAVAEAADADAARSSITVKVEKTGLFSAFAHNHTIKAPIASGNLDTEKRTAALSFSAKEMKVLDEGVKDSERAEIDQTMKSDKVLDVQRFPEIRFASTSITPQDGGRYQVRGDLTLHGITRPIEFPITFSKDRYAGSVKLKQTDFGITPVSIAGGTVKVKDVIEIVFEIVPGRN
jgi:polyisoprenoid-binding protein YceI